MLLRDVPSGTCLAADVAVVGAGPAGIVVALELARAGNNVLLVESGGRRRSDRVQALGDAADLDPHHVPMAMATRRQIGGATAIWGGRCVPFDPIDFTARDSVPARWPVSYADVTGFFQRACDWLVCGRAEFHAQAVPGLAGRTLVPGLPDDVVTTSALERWSLPTNFGRVYGAELRTCAGVRLLTGFTCTRVVRDADGAAVRELELSALDGRIVTVVARDHVLACGGLETTRLLLASGIGDHSGHLGRWYMSHVESRIATVTFTTPPGATIYAHERDPDGVYVRRRFAFPAEVLREHGLPNVALWLVNPEIGDASHRSGVLSFAYLALSSPAGPLFASDAIRNSHLSTTGPVSQTAHVRNVLRDAGPAARFATTFAWQRFLRPGRKVPGFFVPSAANRYPLLSHAEHLPRRDSRVELSTERDALGLPRLRIAMRFGDAEPAGIVRSYRLLDAHLRRHQCGRIDFLDDDPEGLVASQLHGGYHQTGTTRMAARPEDGVLDADLRVHGMANLHVASTSAFPTSSQANSTFMLVVFALRLADRLRALRGS